jgi:biopolymer transport protein ExbD
MIDVTLLLLFFFMLSGKLAGKAKLRAVDLPKVSAEPHAADQKPGECEVLNVDANGLLFVGERPIAPGELQVHLRSRFKQRPGLKLHLRADAATPASKIKELVRMAAETGAQEVFYGIRR